MNTATQTTVDPVAIPELFDEDGFLVDPSIWSADLATQVARHDGLPPLTDRHWKVIGHIRERFFRVGGVPAMRLVCRQTGISRQEVKRLFGGCRTIWRVAGLPNPGEEAKAHF